MSSFSHRFIFVGILCCGALALSAAAPRAEAFEAAPEEEDDDAAFRPPRSAAFRPLEAEEILASESIPDAGEDEENEGKTIDEIIFAAGTQASGKHSNLIYVSA